MTCGKCGSGEFYSSGKCAECSRRHTQAWREKNRERHRLAQAKWRLSNPRYSQSWRAKNLTKARGANKKYQLKIRSEMLEAYGNKCECCGEDVPEFLTLEHKLRDGADHRRRMKGSSGVYFHLRSLGWPKDHYGLLCWNCNTATKFGAVCPHRRTQT
jgi:hypothetical protein